MKCNWTTKKLSEIAYINPRESIGKGVVAKKVPMDKLQPFCRDVPGFVLEEYKGGAKFRNGDTIMARITPCLENGKIAKVSILSDDEVGFGSTEYIVFRAIDGVSDTDFLYYLICCPLVRNPAIKSMVGSSGRQRVQTDVVANLDIELPPIEEQRKIGGLLRAIDDKIELNNKINNNLEQQARSLFKSWFVDYNPFGNTMPSNWKNGKLKDILKLKRKSIKSGINTVLPYLPIDVIPMRTFALTDFKPNAEAQSSLLTFEKDDIIIGAMRVYFHRVVLAPCDGITRTTCFTLAPYHKEYLSFALLCCDQDSSIDYAQSTSKGSTMPYAIWEGGLGDMEIAIPTLEIAQEFNEIVLPMLRQIQNSYFENNRLREIRDGLLPRLMSGELDVSDLDL